MKKIKHLKSKNFKLKNANPSQKVEHVKKKKKLELKKGKYFTPKDSGALSSRVPTVAK